MSARLDQKLALILRRNHRYESYNSEGRLVLARSTWLAAAIATESYGYSLVDRTSPMRRLILWKLNHQSSLYQRYN